MLLVPLAPVIVALAFWARTAGPGPGLVRVQRVGRAGELFGMWKIRSMVVSAEGGLAGGGHLTVKNDDRVTSVGRKLRSFRLDELPQLWNVVRGEMALLGPRPEAPSYVRFEDDRWRRVLSVPPGIVGLTQVLVNRWEADSLTVDDSARVYTDLILPVKVALDDWYVTSADPGLDVLVGFSLLLSLRGRAPTALLRRARFAVPEAVALPNG